MGGTKSFSSNTFQQLRKQHYNARVQSIQRVHEDLMIIRVRSDLGPVHFVPGQHTIIGLGNWEPRLEEDSDEISQPTPEKHHLIRRPYSISCPMLDERDELVDCGHHDFLEFYLTLIREKQEDPKRMTPRLFALKPGDPLYLDARPRGRYTLGSIDPNDDIVFAATGTGEAPHNAMLAQLLLSGHRGRIASVVCVRKRGDLGYLETHRKLEQRFPNYHYIPITTREPENVDPYHSAYVGRYYLQELFASQEFDRRAGWSLSADNAHVFLCGNPQMIGAPRRSKEKQLEFPQPPGMVEVLLQHGFQLDHSQKPGNIHYERYW